MRSRSNRTNRALSFAALLIGVATLAAAAIPAGATAKSPALSVKSIKVSKATGAVASVRIDGKVTVSKKSKSIKVALLIVDTAKKTQKATVKATSKKASKSLAFSTTLATTFLGEVKITATALKKASKPVKATILAAQLPGVNPGGGTPPVPRPTDPPPSGGLALVGVDVGYGHACGYNTAGVAYCWGENTYGKLGRDDDPDNDDVGSLPSGDATAAPVVGGSGFTAIAAGDYPTCGIRSGAARCWGGNQLGEVGNGAPFDDQSWNDTPLAVLAIPTSGVTKIESGAETSCAIQGGSAWCWGEHPGQNSVSNTSTPIQPTGLTANVVDISVGSRHACAVKSDGTVWCWGMNGAGGRLGNGITDSEVPLQVQGLTGLVFTRVSAGHAHTCALTNNGAVYCWGSNSDGQRGDSVATGPTPNLVAGLESGVDSVTTGNAITCAIKSAAAYCLGDNQDGKLGRGTTSGDSGVLAQVTGLASGVTSLSAGQYSVCAVVSGAGYCWGDGSRGELGTGSTGDASQPAPVVAYQ